MSGKPDSTNEVYYCYSCGLEVDVIAVENETRKTSDFSTDITGFHANRIQKSVCSKIRQPELPLHSTVDDEDEEPKFFFSPSPSRRTYTHLSISPSIERSSHALH